MNPQILISLVVQTVMAPRDAAKYLLSLHLSKDVVLTAFALVVTLNALVFQLSIMIAPVPEGMGMLAMPVAFAGMQAVVLASTITALTLTGRAFGGAGQFLHIALLMIWLQVLRVSVQASLLLILPVSDLIAGLVMFVASALGVWILVHFVDEAHGFGRVGKSALVLLLAVVGMAVGLSMLLSLFGVTVTGMN